MEGAKHVEKPGGPVRIMTTEGPKLYRVCGRVCMDQFIVDLHGSAAELGVHEGDTVELFGPGRGEQFVEPLPTTGPVPPIPSAMRSSLACAIAFRVSTSTPPRCCPLTTSPSSIQPRCCNTVRQPIYGPMLGLWKQRKMGNGC